jgi:hypothetical protein
MSYTAIAYMLMQLTDSFRQTITPIITYDHFTVQNAEDIGKYERLALW